MGNNKCEICCRDDDFLEITFHHLIPVKLHKKKKILKKYKKDFLKKHGINVCLDCHKTIHKFYTEEELGEKYNTLEILLNQEKIQKHINYIRKLK